MTDKLEKPLGAIYLRCASSAPENAHSLNAAQKQLEERASLEDVQIVKVYDDKGISGLSELQNRPGMVAMLDDSRNGLFNILYISRIDRLGRNSKQVIETIRQLRKVGISIRVGKQVDDVKVNEEILSALEEIM